MLKSTGMTRKFDDLGRLVIPKEIRDAHGWTKDTVMEIFVTPDGAVAFRPHARQCATCFGMESEKTFVKIRDRFICTDCLDQINKK